MKQIKIALLLVAFALPLFADDETDLRQLDRGIVTATVAQDTAWFEKHLGPDYVLTTSSGRMVNRADFIHSVPLVKIDPYEPTEVVIRVYGDTAIITGRIVQKYSYNGERVEADLRYTDTWLRTKDGWKYAAGHASAISIKRTKETS